MKLMISGSLAALALLASGCARQFDARDETVGRRAAAPAVRS
jgi:hypothetical protein